MTNVLWSKRYGLIALVGIMSVEVLLAFTLLGDGMAVASQLLLAVVCVAALYPGLDARRELSLVLPGAKNREIWARYVLIICLGLFPLVPAVVLWLGSMIFTVPEIHGFAEAYSHIGGLALVHCFLRFCNFPGSVRGVTNFVRTAN